MVGIIVVNLKADQGPYLAIVLTVLVGNLCEVTLEFTSNETLLGYVNFMKAVYDSSCEVQVEYIELDVE